MLKTIIFDYDGVIVDSFERTFQAYRHICNTLGLACPQDLAGFKVIYGYNSRELIKKLKFTPEQIKLADKMYKEEVLKYHSPIFKGTKEMLESLHGKYKLVVITANHQVEAQQKLITHGIRHLFDDVIGQTGLGPMNKVNPIQRVMEEFKNTKEEIVLVGDRNVDYDQSLTAGLKPEHIILVTYGWGFDKKHCTKALIANEPKEIVALITSLSK